LDENSKLEGVFAAVRDGFRIPGSRNLLDRISAVNKFRKLEVPPPRSSRFGSPLVFSRGHWVRPELVRSRHSSSCFNSGNGGWLRSLPVGATSGNRNPFLHSVSDEVRYNKKRLLHHRGSLIKSRCLHTSRSFALL
jgi:hypothetical protein